MVQLAISGISDTLLVDLADGIATFTLNRPAVLNAIDHAQRANLVLAFNAAAADETIRVVVLKGAGRAFCAGQDQKESAAMDAHGAATRIEGYTAVYRAMRALDKPIVACIDGYATGAGLQLALLSDLRFAGENARFGMTELNVGSAAIMGSAFLRPVIGDANMRRLVLLADFIDARTALQMNLVTDVHPAAQLAARVHEVALRLTARAPLAVAITKGWWRAMGDALFDAAMEHARVAHAKNFAAGGFSKGAQAFVARPKA
jgi:enoyl-CoA hydratase/carnithine racemase